MNFHFYVKNVEKIIRNSECAAPDHPVVRLGIERRHVVCAGAQLQEGVWSFSHGRADARRSDEIR